VPAPQRDATTGDAADPPLSQLSPAEFPWLLAMTALAVYLCVPETDQMPAIAAMIVCLAVIEIVARRPSGPIVQVIAAGIVLWSGLYGATGRASAIVGAIFAFWPLVLVFGVALVRLRRERPTIGLPQRIGIGLVGGIAAVAVARTGALQATVGPAILSAAIAAVGSGLVVVLILRLPGGRPGTVA
jgi:hypothetical protein